MWFTTVIDNLQQDWLETSGHLGTWLVLILSHVAGAASKLQPASCASIQHQCLYCMLDTSVDTALVLICSFESGLLQVVKLSPQPHEPFEFGLLNVNSDLRS